MSVDNESVQTPSDDELIARAKSRDMEAFNILHRRYRDRILNYIYRYIGNYQRAEEITQETFLRVYRHLSTYRPRRRFSSWIYRIATNLSRNALRQQRRKPKTSLDASISEGMPELMEVIPDSSMPPDRIAEQREFEKKVQRAVNSLPDKYRQVLLLCGAQNLSYRKAAEVLKCSPQAVGVRLSRARKMMRKALDFYFSLKGSEFR